MEEYRDVYDRYGQKTGKIIGRHDPLLPGEYCRAVCVCLFNSRGEMLLQKRSADKELWPSLWDITAAGGVLAGENGQQAARRELREEMGLDVRLEQERPKLTTFFRDGFSDVFTVRMDGAVRVDLAEGRGGGRSMGHQRGDFEQAGGGNLHSLFPQLYSGAL